MLDFITNRPADVATRETLEFLTSRIPVRATILEVGCGEGRLARELLKRGYHITALDANPNVIAKAQARGVPVVLGSWPKFDTGVAFDAIAFTRSLHHINPLDDAIARAQELLNPRGLLLIEDFALDEVDETTVHWFVRVLHSKQGAARITPVADQLVTELLSSTDVMKTWRKNRGHDLHSLTAMSVAIAKQFVVRETRLVPYFYRYLIPVLAETSEGVAFLNEVFQQEKLLGERGEIVLLGRRIVASRRASNTRISSRAF